MAKKRINNEIGATVFAILLGLAALFLVNWIFGTSGCQGDPTDRVNLAKASDKTTATGEHSSSADTGKVAAATTTATTPDAQQTVQKLKSDRDEEAARRTELAAKIREANAANANLTAEMTALQAKYKDYDAELARRDTEIQKLKEARDTIAKQKTELDAAFKKQEEATKELQKAMSAGKPVDEGAAKKTAELEGKIKTLEQQVTALGAEKTQLTTTIGQKDAEIKKLKDSSTMAAEADANLKKLQAELEALKKSSAEKEKKCSEMTAKLNKEIEELKKQLAETGKKLGDAEAKITEMKNAAFLKPASNLPGLDLPMLVNDPTKLDPKFKPLFIRLREMADNSEAREKVYAELAKEGKTQPLLRIPFQNASAYVSGEFQAKVAELTKAAGEGSKFLVVGYASTDGSAESNQKLSSQRASNVAQQISDGSDGNTQAVYFGQTSRFSTEELPPNRVVEIWQVK